MPAGLDVRGKRYLKGGQHGNFNLEPAYFIWAERGKSRVFRGGGNGALDNHVSQRVHGRDTANATAQAMARVQRDESGARGGKILMRGRNFRPEFALAIPEPGNRDARESEKGALFFATER
jgi:hypothetical protein